MGLALPVPFTFSMGPAGRLLMFAGLYVGAMYGDAIPAIPITPQVRRPLSTAHSMAFRWHKKAWLNMRL